MVSRVVVGGSGGGFGVDGVEISANAAGVVVGLGAGVRCDTPRGRFELMEGAVGDGEGWPTKGVQAKLVVDCCGFFMDLAEQ